MPHRPWLLCAQRPERAVVVKLQCLLVTSRQFSKVSLVYRNGTYPATSSIAGWGGGGIAPGPGAETKIIFKWV